MHVRIIVPPGRRAEVEEVLADAGDAVSDVVLLPDAAVRPAGDLLLCDIERGALDSVLHELHVRGIDRAGSITVDRLELSMSERGKRFREDRAAIAFGGDDDALVWQEITARTADETRLSITYLAFMAIAVMIASVGVAIDQPILLVGAMIVGPDFGPIAGTAVGIVRRRLRPAMRSLLALGIGYATGILFAWGLTELLLALRIYDRDALDAAHPLTAFVWAPDELSALIGFLAGIAGMLSLTSAKSGALIGVLVSVTTVPAAGAIAIAFSGVGLTEFTGSVLQLLINVAAILLGASLTLGWQFAAERRRRRRADA
ncbi:DUF389 domain-containing protein [Agromyces seonyuensis]|nr:DUF389 domain-containing protein [Agromyces seonyuensis]